jgi:hypothetical protein
MSDDRLLGVVDVVSSDALRSHAGSSVAAASPPSLAPAMFVGN